MPVFEAHGLSTLVGATAGSQLFGFKAGGQRARIREIHAFNITAPTTSGALALGRSTADGVGTVTSVAAQPHDPSDAASTAIVWTNYATTLPALGSLYRGWTSPASFGNGFIWVFDSQDPLIVPTSAATAHLIIANEIATAPGTYRFTFVWEE